MQVEIWGSATRRRARSYSKHATVPTVEIISAPTFRVLKHLIGLADLMKLASCLTTPFVGGKIRMKAASCTSISALHALLITAARDT